MRVEGFDIDPRTARLVTPSGSIIVARDRGRGRRWLRFVRRIGGEGFSVSAHKRLRDAWGA